MVVNPPPDSPTAAPHAIRRPAALSLKAVSFALIGLLNTAVDYGVFLAARAAYMHLPAALAAFGVLADLCRCGTPDTVLLIAANVTSWLIAVSGSYVLNSSITFAAESGRRLRLRAYLAFVVAGLAGLIANTAILIAAAQLLALPVWLAKALAVLASFVVNFALSHFVVFGGRWERSAQR
jgi:putative flippase GtrA